MRYIYDTRLCRWLLRPARDGQSGWDLVCQRGGHEPETVATFETPAEAAANVYLQQTGCAAWDGQDLDEVPTDIESIGNWARVD